MIRQIADFLSGTLLTAVKDYQQKSLDIAKIEAAALYLRTVKIVRRQLLALSGLVLCIVALAVALVAFPIALVLLLPASVALKCVLLLLLASVDIGVPLYFFCRFFSESRWMEFTKSDEVISQVVQNN